MALNSKLQKKCIREDADDDRSVAYCIAGQWQLSEHGSLDTQSPSHDSSRRLPATHHCSRTSAQWRHDTVRTWTLMPGPEQCGSQYELRVELSQRWELSMFGHHNGIWNYLATREMPPLSSALRPLLLHERGLRNAGSTVQKEARHVKVYLKQVFEHHNGV